MAVASRKSDRSGLLRWIAVFKLLKAALMVLVGISALKLVHHDSAGTLDHWVAKLGLDPGRHYADLAIGKLVRIPPARLRALGLGSFVYAALFLIEGIGLWLMKKWAEWFTAVLTASLIPLEFYEMDRHPGIGKVLVILVNIAVVVYLLVRIRRERSCRE